jgi:site-specific recombinase XerD
VSLWNGPLAFGNTGCPLAEIQNTSVSDVDFEQRLLRVIRKGGKEDYVPLNAAESMAVGKSQKSAKSPKVVKFREKKGR